MGLGTCLKGYPKGGTFNRELWKYRRENPDGADRKLFFGSRKKDLVREKK